MERPSYLPYKFPKIKKIGAWGKEKRVVGREQDLWVLSILMREVRGNMSLEL